MLCSDPTQNRQPNHNLSGKRPRFRLQLTGGSPLTDESQCSIDLDKWQVAREAHWHGLVLLQTRHSHSKRPGSHSLAVVTRVTQLQETVPRLARNHCGLAAIDFVFLMLMQTGSQHCKGSVVLQQTLYWYINIAFKPHEALMTRRASKRLSGVKDQTCACHSELV